jgi:hypothetical protein
MSALDGQVALVTGSSRERCLPRISARRVSVNLHK